MKIYGVAVPLEPSRRRAKRQDRITKIFKFPLRIKKLKTPKIKFVTKTF